ncbi:hypothetical protein [Luteolibacter soli]|uniref:DUF2029 domain-containing protein n=1 Tax=Luteolibacter soli TaxID=3135280 RepID=A0ABU9AMX8_9BACT
MTAPLSKKPFPLDALLVVGLWFMLCLIGTVSILVLNEGKFTYTLDDPYIHLAVAEQIASGHYGINSTEFSSPCSSAIWPFLLAPLARTPIGEYVPLILNMIFGGLTAMVLLKRARIILPENTAARVVLCWAILSSCNALGIVFNGMEHNLQLLAAVVLVEGMIRITESRDPGKWFWLAVIAGPLVRYENLALSAAACGLLLFTGRPKAAIIAGAAALTGVAAFSFFLHGLGLPLIPSSITAKSDFTKHGGFMNGLPLAIERSFMENRGVLLLLFTSTLIVAGLTADWKTPRGKAALLLAGAGVLHAIFGTYGWFNRYEAYIYASLLFALFALAPAPGFLASQWRPVHTFAVALFALVISYPYLKALPQTPVAANNVYTQQYQMHRFVTGWWKRPVAVNDLGWVSYQNDQHVLDLWGLGSHVALEARLANKDNSWMRDIARDQNVGLVMVYESWIPANAVGWTKVGELQLHGDCVSLASPIVGIFATSPELVPEIESLLVDFRQTLPPAAKILVRSEARAALNKAAPARQ